MMASFRSSRLIPAVGLAALAALAACSSAPAPAKSVGGKQVDTATAGSLAGRVTFSGKPPANEPLRLGTDPACLPGNGLNPVSDAVVVAGDGAVKNVFVYVKDGLDPSYTFTVPTAPATVILDQKGCRYVPRVIGVEVGQPFEIVNSDATMHNVHAIPKVNDEFNSSQPMQGIRTTKTFTKPEVMVLFRCNVHNWMSAHVGVLPHPYFAVTNDGGAFEIKNLPPGTYTIEAWHEMFGTQTAKVTIGDKQAQTVSFTFAQKTESH
jgi:plastocyanin